MKVTPLEIPEIKLIEPTIYEDERGYFFESFNDKRFREVVFDTTFVQDNESKSSKGTLRGLHWQRPPYAQSKLVRVTQGRVYDVAVDIRLGSPTFGKYVGAELSEYNHSQLFIPRGFAHGFIALTSDVIFQYKCDNPYNKESEAAKRWDSVGIDWNKHYNGRFGLILLSDKDKNNPTLDEIDRGLLFDYSIDYYK